MNLEWKSHHFFNEFSAFVFFNIYKPQAKKKQNKTKYPNVIFCENDTDL